MEIKDLQGKLVAVLGYGIEGKAVTAYLIKHGIKPVLFDQKPWDKWAADEQKAIKALGVNFIFGPDCFKELTGFDVAFRSPGIKPQQLTINNLQLTSQTKFFFEHCPAKIIGVTGTKGKGTTCALIYEILKEDTRYKIRDTRRSAGSSKTSHLLSNIYLTGNIGKMQPLDFLDDLDSDDWVVYELSSFQLQDLNQSPHIGVVLMVTTEHLDYHKNIKEYHEAKTAIVKHQEKNDLAIINHDFPSSMAIGAFGKGQKLFFSRRKNNLEQGCFIEGQDIVVAGIFPKKTKILKTSELQLKGSHNLENVCSAALAALSVGCSLQSVKKVLKKFKGLEHRLEFVAEKEGIKFYNDSFSTTPETAIAAIESFTDPEIVILGGSSKNSNFDELAKAIKSSSNIKGIILIGQEAGKIKDSINRAGGFKGKILEGSTSMTEIFGQIKSSAEKGDVVLLSPACASFDMFKSYSDRGEQFKKFVSEF